MILETFDGLLLVRPLPDGAAGIPHVAIAPRHAEAATIAEVVVPPSTVASSPVLARATSLVPDNDGEEWKAPRTVASFSRGDIVLVAINSGHVQVRVDGVEHWVVPAAAILARVRRA